MGRWEPNARGRLEQAALELYIERGFEQTTVAEGAKRAGLTERTFFRHFADKREGLFWGQGALQEVFVGAGARQGNLGGAGPRPPYSNAPVGRGRRRPRGCRCPARGAARKRATAP